MDANTKRLRGVVDRRYSTVALVVQEMNNRDRPLTKTALQKLVYILQQWKRVPAGYTYRMYRHGPYSGMLGRDLDVLAEMGVIEVVPLGDRAVDIRPGPNCRQMAERAGALLDAGVRDVEGVIEQFGSLSARDLELRTSAIYAAQEVAADGHRPTLELVEERLGQLKPAFHPGEARYALKQLERLQVVRLAAQ